MRIALIADTFPPLRTSGAVQLRDLSLEMARQGHQVTVLLPLAEGAEPWRLEDYQGVQVLRLRAPTTKDIGYVRRTLHEFLMPFAMLRRWRESPCSGLRWDGVVWYSPSIFFGPLVKALKTASNCRSYLIIRDIFPEWAVDMGLMGRGLPYRFFKRIERYQYSVANIIGVQTPGNLAYFSNWAAQPGHHVEVLHNWLTREPDRGCCIRVADTSLAGRTLLVYAGNMGVAQGMDILLALVEHLRERRDIGFLFVGRGSAARQLSEAAKARQLENVLFYDEIEPAEIPGLYAQCQVGLVALDPRHTTHNIPGKFLSYMQHGLPVLACVNPGNDLIGLIEGERVGKVISEPAVERLAALALELVREVNQDAGIRARCQALADRLYSPAAAVRQIIQALQSAA